MQQSASKSADSATAPLKPINPFNGQPPGYNYRPPQGPQLPPPPSNGGGSGSGGNALEYQPGKPGNYTRGIAVDITDMQTRNGKQ